MPAFRLFQRTQQWMLISPAYLFTIACWFCNLGGKDSRKWPSPGSEQRASVRCGFYIAENFYADAALHLSGVIIIDPISLYT